MRWGFGAAAVIAAVLVAGCSSSSSGPAPASSAPAPVPVTTPAPTATPTPTPSPSPTPTKAKAKQLSPYEKDPAVTALRAWASQVGHTINSGTYDNAALNALMTGALAKQMKGIFGTEVGHRYPGPLPFTPIKVAVEDATHRDVSICLVTYGFSLNPKTGKPFDKYKVGAANTAETKLSGRWLVSKITAGTFSCAGVKIKEQKW